MGWPYVGASFRGAALSAGAFGGTIFHGAAFHGAAFRISLKVSKKGGLGLTAPLKPDNDG